jgi:hypothetical protein
VREAAAILDASSKGAAVALDGLIRLATNEPVASPTLTRRGATGFFHPKTAVPFRLLAAEPALILSPEPTRNT